MLDNLQSNKNNKVMVSVCIATYRRDTLLEKLLISLIKQVLPPEIKLEIIVADNDSNASAKAVLKKFSDNERIVFKYFIQPQKNISLTRNMCVTNATGEYICFIDDDETADENWINNLINCLYNLNAEGAFGYVEPIFDTKIKDSFKRREFYFSSVGETGSPAKHFYTTNCIIKSELIKAEKVPFDPNYGLTGGEDVHLFERLASNGAILIYCKEAITYEFIPCNRANYKYLFNRALRGGQSFVRRKLEYGNALSFKVATFLKIIIRFLFGLCLLLLYPISRRKSILGTLSIGDSIGKARALLLRLKQIY